MKAAGKLLVPVFVLGLLLGAAAGAWTQRRSARPFWAWGRDPQRSLSRLTRKLDLDAEQQAKAKPLLEERSARLSALRDETRARYVAIRDQTRAELEKILGPRQRAKYAEMLARSEARYQAMLKADAARSSSRSR